MKKKKYKPWMLPMGLICLFLSIITRYIAFPDFLRGLLLGMAIGLILVYLIKNKRTERKA